LEEIRNYISTRYQRYLDYADYHASLAGLDQQGPDVLHEVIISVLKKDEKMLLGLYNKKKKGLRELDFYILRMLNLNCHSLTSPYRFKYRYPAADGNITPADLDQQWDEPEAETVDAAQITCDRYDVIREVLSTLYIFTSDEIEIFKWKFFHGNTWRQWEGKHSKEFLQSTYKAVLKAVIYHIEMRRKSYLGHIAASTERMDEIVQKYRSSLFPGAYRYSQKYRRAREVRNKYSEKLKRITGH
jgi:predicted DNA-binding transcriptional regulator